MCYECHRRVLVLEVCSSFQCKLGHAQRYVSQLTSGIRRNLDMATTTLGNWCCAALQGPVHCMPRHTAALCGASPSRLSGCPWWCHIRRAEQLLERRSDSIQTALSETRLLAPLNQDHPDPLLLLLQRPTHGAARTASRRTKGSSASSRCSCEPTSAGGFVSVAFRFKSVCISAKACCAASRDRL